jgi:uncharacterized protein (TIGR00266 family)
LYVSTAFRCYNSAVEIQVLYHNTFPIAQVSMDAGDAIVAESTTLVGMSPGIQVETKVRSGQIKSYIKDVAGTEAYYLNTYTALEASGEVLLAPRQLGEIYSYNLGEREQRILIRVDAFLGAQANVEIETTWRGASAFELSAGLQMLRCSGDGILLLSSFGAIHRVELEAEESFIVDRGHLVGFTDAVKTRVRQLGGVRSTLLRGQEILIELQGPGNAYLQTRSQDIYLDWLRQHITD